MSVMRHTVGQWSATAAVAAMLLWQTRLHGTPPAHEIQIVASKYAFEPSTIQVTAGEPVRLVVRSSDGTHGFSLPDLHVDVRVPKTGDPVTVEFTAPPPGRYAIACSEFCGSGHGQMKAALVSAGPTSTTR